MNLKEIKKQLRILRKQIKDLKAEKLRAGNREDRRILRNKIKELKAEMIELKIDRIELEIQAKDPTKEKIITEILQYENIKIFDKKYYSKFTITELEKHLKRLKERTKKWLRDTV